MARYTYKVIEEGRQFGPLRRSKREWEAAVRAINLSVETVDAPYPHIKVVRSDRKVVFKQRFSFS